MHFIIPTRVTQINDWQETECKPADLKQHPINKLQQDAPDAVKARANVNNKW